jgi:hypothetical protein
MTFNAKIRDISEEIQPIEVTIYKASFDSGRPLIGRIALNIKNNSNSTIIFNHEKCYFRDNNGFHFLKIPPINLRANDVINISIESFDYYKTEASMYSYGYFGFGSSTTSMQDLNVDFLEIVFYYKLNDREYNGMYFIDVEKINVQ